MIETGPLEREPVQAGEERKRRNFAHLRLQPDAVS